MTCRDSSVRQVLIGLHRVGIVGLTEAIRRAADSGFTERDEAVGFMLEVLRPSNYIPDEQLEKYERSLWREYLRDRGESISELYTEVDVTVRGDPGADRERFVALTRAAMARFELQPVIRYEPPGEEGPNPQLMIRGETVARGPQSPRGLENAVRRSLSDW